MKVALTGLAQSGKKSLFHLLTGRALPPGRREDEPLEGQVAVRDPRVDRLADIAKPQRIRYAETNFVLCPDVQEGGNVRVWLDAARNCELLCPVIRAFRDERVYHPAGSVDPERDRRNLEAEFLLADLDVVEKRLARMEKEARTGRAAAHSLEERALQACRDAIEQERCPQLPPPEGEAIKSLGLLSLKPLVWIYNTDDDQLHAFEASGLPIAVQFEQELTAIEDAGERSLYLQDMGVSASGIERLSQLAYDALGLMSFYTMGKDEVRAWTIRKGTSAPAAGGKIHSDIERGFIRVEVMKYDDLIHYGSEAAVKEAGKAQLKGRDYILEDGDICHFRFNV